MNKLYPSGGIRPSLLDNLLDQAPDQQDERALSPARSLQQLRASVRRDLENLLNSRCRVVSPAAHFTEVQNSWLNYGLPDLATVNLLDHDRKRDFASAVEQVIRRFEPRFKTVRVHFPESRHTNDRTLRFRIDAVLFADPEPQEVVFDSVLEPVLRTVTVEESANG